jgi:serine/threonine-protein kinase
MPTNDRTNEASQDPVPRSERVDAWDVDVRVGADLGKYRLLAELGQGGMSNVFLAVARGPSGFHKLVVLKMLRPSLASDPQFLGMFLDEARLAARLNHPNVVQTNEVGVDGDRYFIAMEYLEGQPLSEIVTRVPQGFTLPMHLLVLSDVLSGLHCAHELADFDGRPLGVVHRDVSPPNVFVTYEGSVKVLDFGIAKLASASNDTQSGVIKGKLRYMAPEQLAGDPVDRRADLYAVGVMLWEAAAGQRIFRDLAQPEIMTRILQGNIPHPSSVNVDCPPALESLCLRAMARDPQRRHATALELRSDVEHVLVQLSDSTSSHDLGRRVSCWFEGERDQIRRAIAAELSGAETMRVSFVSRTATDVSASGTLVSAPASARTVPREALPTASGDRPRRRLWIAYVAAGLAAAGLIAGLAMRPSQTSVAPDEAVVPVTPVAALQPSTVHLRVAVSPPQAQIYVDDQRMSENPYLSDRTRDTAPHRVRAEATGYVPVHREVRLDRDLDLQLVLAPAPAGSTPAPRRPRRGPDRTEGSKPNCAQPYTLDDQGIKKYRPECL